MNKLRPYSLFEIMWLGAPVAIWFSYQPLFRLGANETMYFELSIIIIYTLILALSGTHLIWQKRGLLIKDRAVWLVSVFVAWGALSIIWTDNVLRGVLTTGLIGVIYLLFLASLAHRRRLIKLLPRIAKIYIITAVVMSCVAIFQFFLGLWLEGNYTLLCAGCEAAQFGFARPNVFTIEPQFFGNLLLTPLLILMWLLVKSNKNSLVHVSFIILLSTLFLTLSRGAIYAFIIGAIILFIFSNVSIMQVVRILILAIVAFFSSLIFQGFGGQLNPRLDATFTDSINSSVNHLTLGIVELTKEPNQSEASAKSKPKFDGFIEESSTIRTRLTVSALETWMRTIGSMIFGVGIGGSGVALSEQYPELYAPREIVQNEYAKTLLEKGIVGFIIFTTIIAGLMYHLRKYKWAWSILAALYVQWYFFSGYPNAMHIYYIFIALFVYGMRQQLDKHYK